jgi:hypothetical protein
MDTFERLVDECVEALVEGRWSLDECLRRYPAQAEALRPSLETAWALLVAGAAPPRPEWAGLARERFLVASGQRLQEALDIEPRPSFFAAARVRFLLAAQRMRQEQPAGTAPRVPGLRLPSRAFAGAAAALAIFIGFSGYTVATADAALPGDWRYPVKLQTERVRLALAFTEGQERSVRLDIAEERIREIEQLANKGKTISPGVINRLVDQTQPLVDDAVSGDWDADDASRLQVVSVRGTAALNAAETHVDPDAQDELQVAKAISAAGAGTAREIIIADPARLPGVVTALVVVSTPTPVPPTPGPTEPGDNSSATQPTDAPSVTPAPAEALATPDPSELPTNTVTFSDTPLVELGPIKLHVLRAGRLRLLAPGPGTGWYPEIPSTGIPPLIRVQTQSGQSFVVISTLTGDMYWYISPAGNGRFDEVQLRVTAPNGTVRVGDPALLREMYGDAADIPILMMQSITMLPVPPPAPTTTATPAPAPPSSAATP